MIKRVIGLLAAAAVVAIVVLTVLHRDRYRSMVDPATADAVPESPETIPVLPDSTLVYGPEAEENAEE